MEKELSSMDLQPSLKILGSKFSTPYLIMGYREGKINVNMLKQETIKVFFSGAGNWSFDPSNETEAPAFQKYLSIKSAD